MFWDVIWQIWEDPQPAAELPTDHLCLWLPFPAEEAAVWTSGGPELHSLHPSLPGA